MSISVSLNLNRLIFGLNCVLILWNFYKILGFGFVIKEKGEDFWCIGVVEIYELVGIWVMVDDYIGKIMLLK